MIGYPPSLNLLDAIVDAVQIISAQDELRGKVRGFSTRERAALRKCGAVADVDPLVPPRWRPLKNVDQRMLPCSKLSHRVDVMNDAIPVGAGPLIGSAVVADAPALDFHEENWPLRVRDDE